jgi:hypothetical protein
MAPKHGPSTASLRVALHFSLPGLMSLLSLVDPASATLGGSPLRSSPPASSPSPWPPPGAVAAPASAAETPRSQGAACAQAGLGTLKNLGLLQAAAQKELDYSTLANPTTGSIFTTLPEGSYLSLGQVVKLHTTNPELFAWCR